MTPYKYEKIFSTLEKYNPAPTTELNYATTFELLIAVILSAQATDISVNKATDKLYAAANTPDAILKLGLAGLTKYIKSIGLYNSKAKNILLTCEILIKLHKGKVPESRKELEKLPGVGRKTANVVLNTAFNHPTIAVDTHIFRVSNRIGLASGTTPRQIEDQLIKNIPKKYLKDAHHWLILHGRYICVARKPKCWQCPIAQWCEFKEKTIANDKSI